MTDELRSLILISPGALRVDHQVPAPPDPTVCWFCVVVGSLAVAMTVVAVLLHWRKP